MPAATGVGQVPRSQFPHLLLPTPSTQSLGQAANAQASNNERDAAAFWSANLDTAADVGQRNTSSRPWGLHVNGSMGVHGNLDPGPMDDPDHMEASLPPQDPPEVGGCYGVHGLGLRNSCSPGTRAGTAN